MWHWRRIFGLIWLDLIQESYQYHILTRFVQILVSISAVRRKFCQTSVVYRKTLWFDKLLVNIVWISQPCNYKRDKSDNWRFSTLLLHIQSSKQNMIWVCSDVEYCNKLFETTNDSINALQCYVCELHCSITQLFFIQLDAEMYLMNICSDWQNLNLK